MNKKKICVVTGTRAEYGLLFWLLKELQDAPEFDLQIIATGAHLSPEFGLTYKDIEADGFEIHEKVEMLLSSDTPVGTAKSLGLATIGMADALQRLRPDLLVILGDRYEILAAAQAALVFQIPVGHISGGDITEGSIDDAIRHSISKMAHLHFVNNEISAAIVKQLGEMPERIYNVGSLGIDYIKRARLLDRLVLEETLNFKFLNKNILVTYHPVTSDDSPSTQDVKELLEAIDGLSPEVGVIFTKANADAGGRAINKMIEEFTAKHHNCEVYTSLGQLNYLSVVNQVDAVVGNSSSGLTEIPSFKKATVNIGDRQKGRIPASSVINCRPESSDIARAILRAFSMDCSDVQNPYGDGDSAAKIMVVLKGIDNYKALLAKSFQKLI